jgi:hypothetical protein
MKVYAVPYPMLLGALKYLHTVVVQLIVVVGKDLLLPFYSADAKLEIGSVIGNHVYVPLAIAL